MRKNMYPFQIGATMWSLPVLPMSAWAFSGYSGLLIRPKDVNVR